MQAINAAGRISLNDLWIMRSYKGLIAMLKISYGAATHGGYTVES
jgi:hypothetical protein